MPGQQSDITGNSETAQQTTGYPNLIPYTGSGSENNFTYDISTRIVDMENSVKNSGSATAGGFRVGWYLSTDTQLSSDDILIDTYNVSHLNAGYYKNVSASANLDNVSNLQAGTYYLWVHFDDENDVVEYADYDNYVYFSSPQITYEEIPNLVSYAGNGSDNKFSYNESNHSLSMTNSVKNDGNATAGSFRIAWYLSTDVNITTADYLIKHQNQGSLIAGSIRNISSSIDLDYVTGLPHGIYYLGALIDDQNLVNESDESDNIYVFNDPQVAFGDPNLRIYTGSGSLNSFVYDVNTHAITVNNSIQNDGLAPTGNFRIGWYLSADANITTSDYQIIDAFQNPLAVGATRNINGSINLDNVWGLPTGAYYLGFIVDDLNQIIENDETDNDYTFTSSQIIYGDPNVRVYTGSGSVNSFTYDEDSHLLTVNNSIENDGVAPTGDFQISWYLSVDAFISASDYRIVLSDQDPLANGATRNVSSTIDLDDVGGLPLGSYYLGVIIDESNQVKESNEGDNSFIFYSPLVSFQNPNLAFYTSGSFENSFTYDKATYTLSITSSFINNGTRPTGSFSSGLVFIDRCLYQYPGFYHNCLWGK